MFMTYFLKKWMANISFFKEFQSVEISYNGPRLPYWHKWSFKIIIIPYAWNCPTWRTNKIYWSALPRDETQDPILFIIYDTLRHDSSLCTNFYYYSWFEYFLFHVGYIYVYIFVFWFSILFKKKCMYFFLLLSFFFLLFKGKWFGHSFMFET